MRLIPEARFPRVQATLRKCTEYCYKEHGVFSVFFVKVNFLKYSMSAQRQQLSRAPFASSSGNCWERNLWPAHWISLPDIAPPVVAAYKLEWRQDSASETLIHVSADERYELYLDGQLIGRGPERGLPNCWFFESYQLKLTPGQHRVVARVWSQGAGATGEQVQMRGARGHHPEGAGAPFAQESVRHGFLLCPDDEALVPLLATGVAAWQGTELGGIEWISPLCTWSCGDNIRIDGRRFDWDFENGAGKNWRAVQRFERAGNLGAPQSVGGIHALAEAMLPPMLDQERHGFVVRHVCDTPTPTREVAIREADSLGDEVRLWQSLMNGQGALTIAPHTCQRVIVDLEDYFCARPTLTLSGGRDALLRVHWAESLYHDASRDIKGNRDQIEGKFFAPRLNNPDGVGDQFIADGGASRRFETLWWQAGRYLEIHVQTAEQPLIIQKFALRETRYPLEIEGEFASSDASLAQITPMMTRALQMCAHETYMDCPYYEQLMYVGDTRLQALVTYAATSDDRLARKALRLFDLSRSPAGLTQSRIPSRVPVTIPPFSLCWVNMVHDFALWRDDAAFVQSLLPGVRAVCDSFAGLIGADGLLQSPPDWNFVDGARRWNEGQPVGADDGGVSGVLCWQAAMTFRLASELELWHGEPEPAGLQLRRARAVAAATERAFWNQERGLYSDDLAHQHWSEHAQALAILSGLSAHAAQVGRGLVKAEGLTRATFYFAHYLFEAYRITNQIEPLFARLSDWKVLAENGLKTTIENHEPTRSDCHAWGAHPLFHLFATLAGIRPAAPGFRARRSRATSGALAMVRGVDAASARRDSRPLAGRRARREFAGRRGVGVTLDEACFGMGEN